MENWRRFLKEASEAENQEISLKFYRDPTDKRDYDKEPLTDQEISLLSSDTLNGLIARKALLMHIYVYSELPDMSPAVNNMVVDTAEEYGKEISKRAEEVDWKPDFSDKEKEGKQETPPRAEYVPYPDNEHGQNPDCSRLSVDPLSGNPRDPSVEWTSEECSEEEMSRNCWVNLLTYNIFQRRSDPVDIAFTFLNISNRSYKDVYYEILDSSGSPVSYEDLFEQMMTEQFGIDKEFDGVPVGLIRHEGTLGFRRVWETARFDSRSGENYQGDPNIHYSFCPIPSHLHSSETKRKLSTAQKGTKLLIPWKDPSGEPYMIRFTQKPSHPSTPELPPVPINELGNQGIGSRTLVRVPTDYYAIDADLSGLSDDQWDEIESSQEKYIQAKKSPFVGLKVEDSQVIEYEDYSEDAIKGFMWNFMFTMPR